MVGTRYDRDDSEYCTARSIDTTSAAVAVIAAEVFFAAAVKSRISAVGNMEPRSITPNKEKNPRSEAPSAYIAGRAAEPTGGSRRELADRLAGSGPDSSPREGDSNNVA